jgi:hypothetical protein
MGYECIWGTVQGFGGDLEGKKGYRGVRCIEIYLYG